MSWGEIYNTSWWGVALDTARTVKARPDFFGSQLNLLTSEQPNLVTVMVRLILIVIGL